MQNAATMKSGEDAPVPAAASGAEAAPVAPEPGTVNEVPPVVAPEPAAVSEAEPKEAPQPALVIEAAAEEAPHEQRAEVSAASVDGDGGKCPRSPSTEAERQIPVDPASLRRLGMVADEDSPLSAPSVLTEVVVQSPLLPPLRRPTFVGASLPCSAASSPVHGQGASARCEDQTSPATPSPRAALSSLARQHSAALARLVAAAAPPPTAALSRCASRAEGRTVMAPQNGDEDEEEDPVALAAAEDGSFTCGALCLLIPGFAKKQKPAAAAAAATAVSSVRRQQSRPRRSGASRVASLERFECGSWSPPPPPPPVDPTFCAMEVPKVSCADDTESPVKMAFVFDGGEAPPTRGILKNSASSRLSSARPSTSSSQRHVRFSTAAADAAASCPSSPAGVVTPRLARARAEFNAFLEAQSA